MNFGQHCTFVTFRPWAGNKSDALTCEIVPIAENLLDLEGGWSDDALFPGYGAAGFPLLVHNRCSLCFNREL